MSTRTGTSYFANMSSAILYYESQGETRTGFNEKINRGEITIGKPPEKENQKIFLDREGRYWLEVMEEKTMSKKEIAKKYQENEEDNSHSENILLLAENFGTDEDKRNARHNLARLKLLGFADPDLYDIKREIHSRLFPNIREEYNSLS